MTLIITVFIGCASGILVLYQGLSAKIRVAEFCEDWFAVKSHGSSRRLSYSEIEDVVLDKGPWPNVVISILIRNEEEPLTLFMNVNSRILDTDLYSWLRQKIENSQRRTGLALDIVSGFYGIVITRYNGSAVMTKSVVIVYFRVKCSFPPLLSR